MMNSDNGNKWWEEDKGEVHKKLFAYLENLKIKQAGRSEDNLRNLKLYGNSDVLGLRMGEFNRSSSSNRITLNVVQMAVDTVTARMAKSKPKPVFITEDGDFTLRRQSKLLEQFVMGQFARLKLYRLGPKIQRDSGVFGDGFLYWYWKNDEICCERVFPEEIQVDEDEAVYSDPRQISRTKYISKTRLRELYPQKIEAIDQLGTESGSFMFDSMENDMVTIVETWRLGEGKSKGRHAIAIKTATLLDEVYAYDYIPFTRLSWSERLLGYYSQGIAEILTGIQVEINKILRTIQRSMHMGAIPKIFVESGSKVVSSHLNNDIGTIVTFTGTPPQSGALMSVPQDLYVQLDKLYSRAFEQVGVSQMSTAGEKPSGLNSGKALRTFHDIENERFAVHAQKYEDFYMDCARMVVRMSKDGAKSGKGLKSTVIDGKQMKVIKWEDITITDDQYVMRLYPTNLLSDTPSGRLSDVDDLIQMGLIDQVQAKALLDYPDIEGALSLDNAKYEDILATIEQFVDKGIYQPPEEFQDLSYGIGMIQLAYLKYKRWGLEDERLDLFRTWIEDAMLILSPPQPEIDPEQELMALMEAEMGEAPMDAQGLMSEEELLALNTSPIDGARL